MSGIIVLTRTAFDIVLANLIGLEERKEKLLQEYYPAPSRERSETIDLIDSYVSRLEGIMGSVTVDDGGSAEFPFVVIGSRVTAHACTGDTVSTHRLVGPLHELVEFGDVSFLSPMGRALLLRGYGDKFTVKAPDGASDYLIRSIRLV